MRKASEGDGLPYKLFQILKDDAVNVLHSLCQQIWKSQQWLKDWKIQFSFQSHRRAMPKNVQTTAHLCSFHIQQCNAQNPLSQASIVHELRNSRGTSWIQKRQNQRSNCQHPLDHRKSKRIPGKKKSISPSLTRLKPLTVWITTNWKILKEMGMPDHFTCLLEKPVCRARSKSQYQTQNSLVQNWERSLSRLNPNQDCWEK